MERNIAAIFDLWTPDKRWDESRLKKLGITLEPSEGFIASEARAIGPLVKIHAVTGYGPALELAIVFKEKARFALVRESRFATAEVSKFTMISGELEV